jgi:hypothetical protein
VAASEVPQVTEQTKPGLPRGLASTAEARDAVATLICAELETGLSIKVACDLVGVTNAWYYRWKKLAEQGNEEAIILMRKLGAARAKGLKEGLGRIKAKADRTDDWRADAWMIDKLYPNLARLVEEIEYAQSGEQQDDKPRWSTPDRLRAVVLGAVETGIVSLDELLAMAPKQPAPRPSIQAAADPLDRIRDAVVAELADGPREQTELRDVVCALTGCSREQLNEACDGLELEQSFSQGSRRMVRLANQPDQATRTSAVQPTAGPERRTDQPASPSDDQPSQRGSWFDGDSRGVGDFIREKRGR